MEWILKESPSASLREYHLSENGKVVAVLKYNPVQKSARISTNGTHRLFFVEKAGFRKTKTILENEYGVPSGQFLVDKLHDQSGDVNLNDRSYHFKVLNEPVPTLALYEADGQSSITTCTLSFLKKNTAVSLVKDNEYACLLLGLCWYFFLQKSQKSAASPVLNIQPTVPLSSLAFS